MSNSYIHLWKLHLIYILKKQFIKVDIKGNRSGNDLFETRLGPSSNDWLIVKWLESFVQMLTRILLQGGTHSIIRWQKAIYG